MSSQQPPLPPSSLAARRRSRMSSSSSIGSSSNFDDSTGDFLYPGTRRVRSEDTNDARSTSTTRYAHHRSTNSSGSLPRSAMTTDEEIERIREMRARRKRAEQEQQQQTQTQTPQQTTARRSSIGQDELQLRMIRRGHRRPSSIGTESVGDDYSAASGYTAASSAQSDDVIRSEIEARLAERRRRRNSASATTATIASAATESRHRPSKSSTEYSSSRFDRNLPLRSNSSESLRRSKHTTDGDTAVPPRTRTTTTKPSHRRSNSSGDAGPAVAMEPYESRRAARLPTRSTSNDISERLRERREARERERKERERKYDLKRASESSMSMSASMSASMSSSISSVPSLPPSKPQSPIRAKTRGTFEKEAAAIRETKMPLVPAAAAADDTSDTDENDTTGDWSLRLCVISATDLPSTVVPKLPLCPVLKMGLVELPTNRSKSTIANQLAYQSIEKVVGSSSKLRWTTPKILSKRDNGSVDFHQEYRWDSVQDPKTMGLCVELCARGVNRPLNYKESPLATAQYDAYVVPNPPSDAEGSTIDPSTGMVRNKSFDGLGQRRGSLWNRNQKKQQEAEMEAAEAAAAVARMLLDDGDTNESDPSQQQQPYVRISETPNSDYDVTLRSSANSEPPPIELTTDVRLGSVVIPLKELPIGNRSKTVRLEQWHRLEVGEDSTEVLNGRKKPSVLLEISLSSQEVLDDSEDELEDDDRDSAKASALLDASFFRRASIEARCQTGEQESKKEQTKTEDPVLEPGVIDFVAVVGCKNIGNQKNDGGMKGWVKATPECVILEQFPPNNEFHSKNGRKALLPEMIQWFCYPEGARLWRGTAPPSHTDLNLKRFSAASPPSVASPVAAFDASLACTTSFSWFVIASNSDEYGSSLVKTYGAVIRFYVPAPTGIDPTQDDFAQAIMGKKPDLTSPGAVKRLWVPIAICLTSNLPIVGVMEALLLRVCEELSPITNGLQSPKIGEIQAAVANIVLNYQKPIAGAVNCSVPFLAGDRFLLSLPPRSGLPPLPHGRALVSVCRLLGADGLNYLLAAVLTECKILLHSEEIAEIAMVAEVVTALTYPFTWSLPYIPILPVGMIEFVEAPLSYMLGVPTCNMKLIDSRSLDDTVVVDLNKALSSAEYSPEKLKSKAASSKHPALLPVSVATKISNAVYKLLRDEEEMEAEYGGSDLLEQSFPRLEGESLAEREFRVTVAIEICGLLRGYHDCVGAVFNRDKFLKNSPVLYEEKTECKVVGAGASARSEITKTKVLSSRSKRFLSSLISGQNFQQLLESLDSEETSFFHEILDIIDESLSDRKPPKRTSSGDFGLSQAGKSGLSQAGKNVELLMYSLQKIEDKIPTFCVKEGGGLDTGEDDVDGALLPFMYDEVKFDELDPLQHDMNMMNIEEQSASQFFKKILSPIEIESTSNASDPSMQAISMEYLAKLETTPWQYNQLFNISSPETKTDKIKLREAIGEKRFRAWKSARDKKRNDDDDLGFLSESTKEVVKQESAVDLAALVTSAKNDTTDSASLSLGTNQLRTSSLTPAQQRIAAAKSRDIIRRCLDRTKTSQPSGQANPFMENGRDLMGEAEKALRNPSAQAFLISILAQRSRLDNKRSRTMRQHSTVTNSASRLDGVAFDCLVRLSCAMLDACMEYKEYEMAYHLLTNSAGFIMVQLVEDYAEDEEMEENGDPSMIVITMTSRIGLHPIFADIGVWEAVMAIHLRDRETVKKSSEFGSFDADSDDEAEEEAEYEAAVATLYEMVGYGIPGEELSRFAMRASQENGWFIDDRGRQLLMLARRISIRRDQADVGGAGNAGDIDMVRKGPEANQENASLSGGSPSRDKPELVWKEIGWVHPAAPSRKGLAGVDGSNTDSVDGFMKRTPVTAIASFGSSMVASGGLDGGVFLAHLLAERSNGEDSSADNNAQLQARGIHLDWGSASRAGSGLSSDGEYGVGAVSCLAVTDGDTSHGHNSTFTKDTKDATGEVDFADSMEGSRIIAGTTAGDLRVWSVKDIYSSILMVKDEKDPSSGHGPSRLKYSLRGRALSGHRGGVTCVDVPSQLYRPDSLVTGGADGLIKLWALRAQTGSRRSNHTHSSNDVDAGNGTGQQPRGRGGDALHTLNGHVGRVLCIKTAWHGDHLLSGGADRSIRVWDLAASGGKCIHRLCGHFGWITDVQYWGPNTIVSASTDRSVALWDARVRSSPLFILRNHKSPISDLLVGSRTDPYMVSAGADGAIATWDFRSLSDTSATENSTKGCRIVRVPSASMNHDSNKERNLSVGPVHLARDVTDPMNAFLSVGSDAILRKWDVASGRRLEESPTGHCDTISNFESFSHGYGLGSNAFNNSTGAEESLDPMDKGLLTSSLDGTIRMRKLVGRKDDSA